MTEKQLESFEMRHEGLLVVLRLTDWADAQKVF